MSSNRKRLSIEISDEQSRKLAKYIPWGIRTMLFLHIIDQIIELCEEGHGTKLIAAVIADKVKVGEDGYFVPGKENE